MLQHASTARLGLFARDKVHSFHRCVTLDLIQIKRHLQNALCAQQALTAAFTRPNLCQIAKYAQKAHIALLDLLVKYFVMQELTTVFWEEQKKKTARSLNQVTMP